MKAFRADSYENLTLFGSSEDIDEPVWAGHNWPLVMVVNGTIIERFIELANMFGDQIRPNKPIFEESDYYVYPASKGEVTEYGNVITGINFKIFDEGGFPIFGDKGFPFEIISLFNKE